MFMREQVLAMVAMVFLAYGRGVAYAGADDSGHLERGYEPVFSRGGYGGG